jgi:BAG domain
LAAAGRSRGQALGDDAQPTQRAAAVDRGADGLALGPDEVVMDDPGSLRRYIFNKRTRNWRWLSDADAGSRVAAENGFNGPTRSSTASSGPRKARTAKPSSDAIRDIQRALRGGAVRRLKVLEKLRSLADTVREIEVITATNSIHNLDALRGIIAGKKSTGMTRKEANLRLLELGEYCTQRMLKADGVDSAGNAIVRQRRKKTVTLILSIIDQVESLRAKLAVSEAKHR